MKKVLGIDLGHSSIGWALIEENDATSKIIALGSRIIPLSSEDEQNFKGMSETKNHDRTLKRGQRRLYDRYVIRRNALIKELIKNNLFDKSYLTIPKIELWKLRAMAIEQKLSLSQIGRILYHLNQKRGYKSIRKTEQIDKKESQYLEDINSRYNELIEKNITIGQKFYNELLKDENFRIKEQVYPRNAYIDEYNQIMKKQKEYYPEILTDELIDKLRDKIIYYQRPLKSQKHLVGICELEGKSILKDGKEILIGPKVAHKSSPLFQVAKIWESINNIKLKKLNKNPQNLENSLIAEIEIPLDKKYEIFKYLNEHDKITKSELFEIIGLDPKNNYINTKGIDKGIQGNITLTKIKNALEGLDYDSNILKLDLNVIELEEEVYLIDKKSGEIKETKKRKIVDKSIENSPLFQLWHTIYSIKDENECKQALIKKFNLSNEAAEKLSKLDLDILSFGNKSNKAIRKILPYLMEGYVYSDAASFAGYNHSNSLTKDEILKKTLKDKLNLLPKNSLRQPVVEKILNQLIHLVNKIIDPETGLVTREERIQNNFEIRIEMARELKASKEERKDIFNFLQKREKENIEIRKEIESNYQLKPTTNTILKWRLYHEITDKKSPQINATCIYCGETFGLAAALSGEEVDIEHIIPKSLRFDDSQANKTLSHRKCNAEKGNKTAFDYMKSKGEDVFKAYQERVIQLAKKGLIGKTKMNNFLTSESKLETDFIQRQLKETQYISRKAIEILKQISYNVWSTSGTITSKLRTLWGWNDVLSDLQLPLYKEIGLTEFVTREDSVGNHYKKEVISNWTKRNDYRHHALDALTIACTKQGFIQRINTLSSKSLIDKKSELKGENNNYHNNVAINLEKYLKSQIPFSPEEVKDAISKILISFKSGKKVATYSVRKKLSAGKKVIVQRNILTPRGPLTEETVYGKIKIIEKEKPLKYIFANPDSIVKKYIKDLVKARLALYDNNSKLALSSLTKDPIYLDEKKEIKLTYASCYQDAYVVKTPIKNIKQKDIPYIVDLKVRQLIKNRLEQYNYNVNEAFKEPLYFDSEKKKEIKRVRIRVDLKSIDILRKDENNRPIAFVIPGNNHHLALYYNDKNQVEEHICTFWHAVERKKYGVPIIIKNPKETWDYVMEKNFDLPEDFLSKLPPINFNYYTSLQKNEMFILGMDNESFEKALYEKDYKTLSQYLYRVQKLSSKDYYFRHHLEPKIDDSETAKAMKKFYRITSIQAFTSLNPKKVKISLIGELSLV